MAGSWWARAGKPVALGVLAFTLALAGCGRTTSTPTPSPTATPTVAATPTRAATASPGGTVARATRTASPVANPAAVTAAYANLRKLDSYHLDMTVTGLSRLIPFGAGDTLTYRIDYYQGNQRVQLVDPSGATQEYLKIGNKTYSVIDGQATELPSPPLLLMLPDLLYSNLTAPGVTTFTMAGEERINDRATTKYDGSGQVAALASNPLLAPAVAGASGDIAGQVWVDREGGFLVASDLRLNLTAPQPGMTTLRLDTTKVNDPQAQPIELPR